MEAEKILLQPSNDNGAFLIRDSESRRNDFSLSSMPFVVITSIIIKYVFDAPCWDVDGLIMRVSFCSHLSWEQELFYDYESELSGIRN